MYPDLPISRWLAALVPFVITTQFALVGTGILKDEADVRQLRTDIDERGVAALVAAGQSKHARS